jgi:hypothetical protein
MAGDGGVFTRCYLAEGIVHNWHLLTRVAMGETLDLGLPGRTMMALSVPIYLMRELLEQLLGGGSKRWSGVHLHRRQW